MCSAWRNNRTANYNSSENVKGKAMGTGRPMGRPRKNAPKPSPKPDTIIRCGECKHFNESTCPMVISYTVKKDEKSSGWYETFRNTADDWCSRAERREDA